MSKHQQEQHRKMNTSDSLENIKGKRVEMTPKFSDISNVGEKRENFGI